jgi:hypothetical protein
MSSGCTSFRLFQEMFHEQKRSLVEAGTLRAHTFRFHSGVSAVQLSNQHGELVLLPFQGQQIWSARFQDRDLAMRSMFDQPYPTRDFLATFGGFMQHCGAVAMGGPGPEDHHPLHGELPNAPYSEASLSLGQDKIGAYLGLTGTYHHTVAFSYNYLAQPYVKLYAEKSFFRLGMRVTNLKNTAMPLMYLAHINFKPADYGRLVYTARCTPQSVRVRSQIPAHIQPGPGYAEFLQELSLNPEKHHILTPGLAFDPEVVFFIDYLSDTQGWASAMQVHPDGRADYVRHRPGQLNHGIRWICRTKDQDALGFEAGTAEVDGFTAEKKKGNLRELGPGGVFECEIEVGVLGVPEALRLMQEINQLVENA